MAATCRKKGFEVFDTPIENVKLPAESSDVIVSFEVIEHLFSPEGFIEQCVKFLRTSGLFICTCPNIEALGTLVLKEKATVVDHEHVNYFSPTSISLLFARAGLEVVEVSTPGELDVDLLKKAFLSDESLQKLNAFLSFVLLKKDEATLTDFQEFIKRAKLSSHMWIVGRKAHLE